MNAAPEALRPSAIVAAGRSGERRIVAALSEAGWEIGARVRTADDVVRAAAGTGARVAIVHWQLSALGGEGHALVGALHAVRPPVFAIVVLPPGRDPEDVSGEWSHCGLWIRENELAVHLADPDLRGDASESGGVSFADAAPPPPPRVSAAAADLPAAVVAVTSGKGAPGKTAVAIGLAAAIADELGPDRSVIADFDLRGGNVAPWLALDQSRGLTAALSRAAAEAAGELQSGPGFRALAGIEHADRRVGERESAAALDALAASLGGGVVVCDCASGGEPAAVAGRAGVTVLVVGPDLVAAWNARETAARLRERGAPIVVAINRRRRGTAPPAEILAALDLHPDTPIVSVPEAGMTGVQERHGLPGDASRGAASAFRSLASVALAVLRSGGVAAAPEPPRRRRLFGRRGAAADAAPAGPASEGGGGGVRADPFGAYPGGAAERG